MVLAFVLLRGYVKPAQVRHQPANSDSDTKENFLEKFQRVDAIGALLFIGGGILILLGLNWGSTQTWNEAKVIATLVLGGVLAIAFILWEWFAEPPLIGEVDGTEKVQLSSRPSWFRPETMIPLEVFKNYDVCATQFAAFSSGMVMLVNLIIDVGGSSLIQFFFFQVNFYFLAIFFTIVLNKDASQAGVQLIYFAPGMVSIRIFIIDRSFVFLKSLFFLGCRNLHINFFDKISQTGIYLCIHVIQNTTFYNDHGISPKFRLL